jgi:predicted O-methyltransferase YrrM|tara:strand:+ start:182 stop:757 length:576 start_codon:yes stop_codon:yes gene_type:complete
MSTQPNFGKLNVFSETIQTQWMALFNENNIDIIKQLSILELGTGLGSSAFWITNNLCHHVNSLLVTVDNFKNIEHKNQRLQAYTNLELVDYPEKVTVVHQEMQKFAFNNKDYYDLIYFDAAHNMRDVVWSMYFCEKFLKQGGVLIVDDADFVEVAKGMTQFLAVPNQLREVYITENSQRAFIKEIPVKKTV